MLEIPRCFADGPKNPPKTGTKRPRGKFGSTSSAPQPNDRHRFPTPSHCTRFVKIAKYKTWHEKVFEINSDSQHQDMLHMFLEHGWTELLKPYTKININLLKEFYYNVVPDSSPTTMAGSFSFTTHVRGKTIHFDRDAINDFLGNL